MLTIFVKDSNGAIKASATAPSGVTLVYEQEYQPGDCLCLTGDTGSYVVAQLEDSIAPAFGILQGDFCLPVPFGEKRARYSPKNFMGNLHLLTARLATEEEILRYRNLAANPLDSHENSGLFPHAFANVETRGESVFAAPNAINENHANRGHGPWPYESWGINQQRDAQITVEFGRPVEIDKVSITLRAHFPHDSWWTQGTLRFSDGSSFTPHFVKSDQPQYFALEPRTITWVTLGELIKTTEDDSPFPALTQLEVWGTNKK